MDSNGKATDPLCPSVPSVVIAFSNRVLFSNDDGPQLINQRRCPVPHTMVR
jgi:hypothetical protein